MNIKSSLFAIGIICLSFFSTDALAQPFTLPALGYNYDALEPYIDAQTMEIHYSKHHQAYLTNLNKAVAGTKADKLPLEDLLIAAERRGNAIRNNGGGHYNHTLFWNILSPAGVHGMPPERGAGADTRSDRRRDRPGRLPHPQAP